MELDRATVRAIVSAALDEDLGQRGDLTSAALIPPKRRCTAHLVARSDLILAGLPVAREVFRTLDAQVDFRALGEEGQGCAAGDRVATVSGLAAPLLGAERTALNFLMRMCGIASAARAAVEEVAGTGASILDTRKTAPGLRHLDKYAVSVGGAQHPRMGLHDAVMIKDTHLGVVGSVGLAVARALDAGHPPESITVEVGDVGRLREAIEAGAGRALLDNMDLELLRDAVRAGKGRIVLEASGGLRPGRLREIAETGVDALSLGCLTHSSPAADLAMETESSR